MITFSVPNTETSAPTEMIVGGVNPEGVTFDRTRTTNWQEFRLLGGLLVGGVEAVSAADGTYLFGTNGVGQLWYRKAAAGAWGDWVNLGGTLAIE